VTTSAGSPPTEAPAGRLLRVFVLLVAAHSLAVGLGLLLLPEWTAAFAGFGPVRPPFFVRQAGVFHVLLAVVYVVELRRGSVALLVTAKSFAFVFLGVATLAGTAAWAVPLSAASDGLMGIAAAWLHRRAREPRPAGPA